MKTKIRRLLETFGLDPDDEVDVDDQVQKAIALVVPIRKVDTERRLIFGVVYEPDVADAHGDAMTAADIEESAHGFLKRYGALTGELGTDHTAVTKRNEVAIVESFIAPVDFQLGDQLVTKGSWILAAKVIADQLWKDVKSGKFTGWSLEGMGVRVPAAA